MKKHLKTASILAHMLDSQFNILGFKFGLSVLIDIIPIFGDMVDAFLSLYLVWIGVQMRIPLVKLFEMIWNIAINFVIGGIPLIGEAIYVLRKVNLKNLKILESYA